MTMTATYALQLTVVETLDTQVEGASNPDITHNAFNINGILTDQTASPVTHVLVDEATLSGTTQDYDLTAYTGTGGGTKDATGLKVQGWIIKNLDDTNIITFQQGATNPYPICGATSDIITIQPGGARMLMEFDKLPEVSSTVKTIRVTGTDTKQFQIIVVMG
jgi:hypothetical protein